MMQSRVCNTGLGTTFNLKSMVRLRWHFLFFVCLIGATVILQGIIYQHLNHFEDSTSSWLEAEQTPLEQAASNNNRKTDPYPKNPNQNAPVPAQIKALPEVLVADFTATRTQSAQSPNANPTSINPSPNQNATRSTATTSDPSLTRNHQPQTQTETETPPPRLVLGIFSSPESNLLENRHFLRTTYLAFDSVHNTTTPNRVCSLWKFSTKPKAEWGPFECQMVYAFLAGGNPSRNEHNTPPSKWRARLADDSSDVVIPPQGKLKTMISRDVENNTENDWLILNADESYTSYKLWSWHQYISRRWNHNNGTSFAFDYIAHTDRQVLLYPIEFWSNPIFSSRPSLSSSLSSSTTAAAAAAAAATRDHPKIYEYAGFPNDNKSKEVFSLVSNDLLDVLVQADPADTYGVLTSTNESSSLERIVRRLAPSSNASTSSLVLKGVKATSGDAFSFFTEWDKYKDNIVAMEEQGGRVNQNTKSNTDAKNTRKKNFLGPSILMGIFTMESEQEKERRAAVRSTYLSYYKNESATPYRICSLQELLRGTVPNNGADCQMAYAFVMGSNPSGPTELLEPNMTFPITVVPGRNGTLPAEDDEDDIVHLNIRENMEDGKSPTWFKYATLVFNNVSFDYVGKTDTDSLIYPNKLLDGMLAKCCPASPDNVRVYGGRHVVGKIGNPNLIRKMVGPSYFSGEMYWMSSDLARFVSSPECDRRVLDFKVEDHAMGNFVHSYPGGPIRRVPLSRGNVHMHPLKNIEQYRQAWESFLKKNPPRTTAS